jgi:ATP-dependent exoDNAse (exonuclease V) beta subunit
VHLNPVLRKIIEHRGSDLQIIACAGSGKTESIARRTAQLIAEGVSQQAKIAFTFTERAGEELRDCIYLQLQWLGSDASLRPHDLCEAYPTDWTSQCSSIGSLHGPATSGKNILGQSYRRAVHREKVLC